MTDFEQKLRQKLSEEYSQFKAAFIRFCQTKAKTFLEPDIQKIQHSLLDGNFSTIDEAMEEIEKIKRKFASEGPQFEGAKQILAEICSQLVVKVASYVSISGR